MRINLRLKLPPFELRRPWFGHLTTLPAIGFAKVATLPLKLGAVFVRKTGVGERHGVHLFRKTVSCLLSGRLHHISELDKSGFADGEKQGGFILEVLVRGRRRNTNRLPISRNVTA